MAGLVNSAIRFGVAIFVFLLIFNMFLTYAISSNPTGLSQQLLGLN